VNGILRAVLSMSAVTALSRLTGFGRTMAQAAALGAGTIIGNAYTLSNTLPNQLYELFMGGLLSAIFIPLLVERLTNEGAEDARRLTNALLTLVLPFLAGVALLGVLLAGPIVDLTTTWDTSRELSPEEAARTRELAVLMFRIFAVKVLFYGLGAIAMGVLNAHRRFFLPTFAPILNNLIVIAAFAGYWVLGGADSAAAIYVLASGTALGVAVMSLILLPPMWRLGYRPAVALGHPALRSAARLAVPMLVFVASSVGVQLVANRVGSQFVGVDTLWLAFTIFQLPYGVFVVAIATALMPELSERHAREDEDGYRETLSFGLRTMAFIVVPAAVGMISLAQPIVGLLYERGRFTPEDTESVAAILTAYGVGLLGYAAYFVLVRSFYARQNTKTPAALNVVLLALYIVSAYALSARLGLVGVALAFSLSYAVLALALLAAMRQGLGNLDGRRMLRSLVKVLVAGVAMYAAAVAGTALLGAGTGLLNRLLIICVVGGLSVAVYLGCAYLLRAEELKSATGLLRRRMAR